MVSPGTPRARAVLVWPMLLAAAAVTIALDQLTKQVALATLADGPVDLIPGAVTFRLTFNPGGAFGLLQGLPGIFLPATLAVIVLILLWARKLEDQGQAVPLGMVLGGGIGNVLDRLLRDGGRVVDFVDLHVWPIFNVADSAIVIGVAAVLILSMRRPATER